jgi:adenylylsulfate kinase-like enzyme
VAIIWLTGNSGAGKSTLANRLCRNHSWTWINLDGDVMRQSISVGAGFTKSDREEHNLRIARLANVLHDQGFNIVVSVIAPFASTRKKIEETIPYGLKWVYIKREGLTTSERPYEEPTGVVTINTGNNTVEESYDKLRRAIYE